MKLNQLADSKQMPALTISPKRRKMLESQRKEAQGKFGKGMSDEELSARRALLRQQAEQLRNQRGNVCQSARSENT